MVFFCDECRDTKIVIWYICYPVSVIEYQYWMGLLVNFRMFSGYNCIPIVYLHTNMSILSLSAFVQLTLNSPTSFFWNISFDYLSIPYTQKSFSRYIFCRKNDTYFNISWFRHFLLRIFLWIFKALKSFNDIVLLNVVYISDTALITSNKNCICSRNCGIYSKTIF